MLFLYGIEDEEYRKEKLEFWDRCECDIESDVVLVRMRATKCNDVLSHTTTK